MGVRQGKGGKDLGILTYADAPADGDVASVELESGPDHPHKRRGARIIITKVNMKHNLFGFLKLVREGHQILEQLRGRL